MGANMFDIVRPTKRKSCTLLLGPPPSKVEVRDIAPVALRLPILPSILRIRMKNAIPLFL